MRGTMGRILACMYAAAATLVVTGCLSATRMPLRESAETLYGSSGPLLLMTATIRNDYRPGYQPRLLLVHVEKTNAKPRDNSREGKFNFAVDDLASQPAGAGNAGM